MKWTKKQNISSNELSCTTGTGSSENLRVLATQVETQVVIPRLAMTCDSVWPKKHERESMKDTKSRFKSEGTTEKRAI